MAPVDASPTAPTELERAVRAVVMGAVLGLVVALAAPGARPR